MASKHLIFAVALSFASLAMAPSDGVVLRKTLKSTTETYHMVSTTTQQISLPGGTGDQDLVSSSKATYTLKIGTVDASGDVAPAALTTKIEQYDVSGALADIIPSDREKYLKPSTTSGTIDSHNRSADGPICSSDIVATDQAAALPRQVRKTVAIPK